MGLAVGFAVLGLVVWAIMGSSIAVTPKQSAPPPPPATPTESAVSHKPAEKTQPARAATKSAICPNNGVYAPLGSSCSGASASVSLGSSSCQTTYINQTIQCARLNGWSLDAVGVTPADILRDTRDGVEQVLTNVSLYNVIVTKTPRGVELTSNIRVCLTNSGGANAVLSSLLVLLEQPNFKVITTPSFGPGGVTQQLWASSGTENSATAGRCNTPGRAQICDSGSCNVTVPYISDTMRDMVNQELLDLSTIVVPARSTCESGSVCRDLSVVFHVSEANYTLMRHKAGKLRLSVLASYDAVCSRGSSCGIDIDCNGARNVITTAQMRIDLLTLGSCSETNQLCGSVVVTAPPTLLTTDSTSAECTSAALISSTDQPLGTPLAGSVSFFVRGNVSCSTLNPVCEGFRNYKNTISGSIGLDPAPGSICTTSTGESLIPPRVTADHDFICDYPRPVGCVIYEWSAWSVTTPCDETNSTIEPCRQRSVRIPTNTSVPIHGGSPCVLDQYRIEPCSSVTGCEWSESDIVCTDIGTCDQSMCTRYSECVTPKKTPAVCDEGILIWCEDLKDIIPAECTGPCHYDPFMLLSESDVQQNYTAHWLSGCPCPISYESDVSTSYLNVTCDYPYADEWLPCDPATGVRSRLIYRSVNETDVSNVAAAGLPYPCPASLVRTQTCMVDCIVEPTCECDPYLCASTSTICSALQVVTPPLNGGLACPLQVIQECGVVTPCIYDNTTLVSSEACIDASDCSTLDTWVSTLRAGCPSTCGVEILPALKRQALPAEQTVTSRVSYGPWSAWSQCTNGTQNRVSYMSNVTSVGTLVVSQTTTTIKQTQNCTVYDQLLPSCSIDSDCVTNDKCLVPFCNRPSTPRGFCSLGLSVSFGGLCNPSVNDQCALCKCNGETGLFDSIVAYKDCDDGNPCTYDTCDPLVGCINEPIIDTIPNNDWCMVETCDPLTGIHALVPRNCGTGFVCDVRGSTNRNTVCHPKCVSADPTSCDYMLPPNECARSRCLSSGKCTLAVNFCVASVCDSSNGECVETPLPSGTLIEPLTDDLGTTIDTIVTCTNSCPVGTVRNETNCQCICDNKKCASSVNIASCNTASCMGNVCTQTPVVCNSKQPNMSSTCFSGACIDSPIVPPTCPGDVCNTGAYSFLEQRCVKVPENCDDHNPATADFCSIPNGGCQHIINCNDTNICTADTPTYVSTMTGLEAACSRTAITECCRTDLECSSFGGACNLTTNRCVGAVPCQQPGTATCLVDNFNTNTLQCETIPDVSRCPAVLSNQTYVASLCSPSLCPQTDDGCVYCPPSAYEPTQLNTSSCLCSDYAAAGSVNYTDAAGFYTISGADVIAASSASCPNLNQPLTATAYAFYLRHRRNTRPNPACVYKAFRIAESGSFSLPTLGLAKDGLSADLYDLEAFRASNAMMQQDSISLGARYQRDFETYKKLYLTRNEFACPNITSLPVLAGHSLNASYAIATCLTKILPNTQELPRLDSILTSAQECDSLCNPTNDDDIASLCVELFTYYPPTGTIEIPIGKTSVINGLSVNAIGASSPLSITNARFHCETPLDADATNLIYPRLSDEIDTFLKLYALSWYQGNISIESACFSAGSPIHHVNAPLRTHANSREFSVVDIASICTVGASTLPSCADRNSLGVDLAVSDNEACIPLICADSVYGRMGRLNLTTGYPRVYGLPQRGTNGMLIDPATFSGDPQKLLVIGNVVESLHDPTKPSVVLSGDNTLFGPVRIKTLPALYIDFLKSSYGNTPNALPASVFYESVGYNYNASSDGNTSSVVVYVRSGPNVDRYNSTINTFSVINASMVPLNVSINVIGKKATFITIFGITFDNSKSSYVSVPAPPQLNRLSAEVIRARFNIDTIIRVDGNATAGLMQSLHFSNNLSACPMLGDYRLTKLTRGQAVVDVLNFSQCILGMPTGSTDQSALNLCINRCGGTARLGNMCYTMYAYYRTSNNFTYARTGATVYQELSNALYIFGNYYSRKPSAVDWSQPCFLAR